jgi:hypothetical protein
MPHMQVVAASAFTSRTIGLVSLCLQYLCSRLVAQHARTINNHQFVSRLSLLDLRYGTVYSRNGKRWRERTRDGVLYYSIQELLFIIIIIIIIIITTGTPYQPVLLICRYDYSCRSNHTVYYSSYVSHCGCLWCCRVAHSWWWSGVYFVCSRCSERGVIWCVVWSSV